MLTQLRFVLLIYLNKNVCSKCVRLRKFCRETQTEDQGLSVISCFKYIDKLDGQTIRCIEELCETLLQKN